MIEILPTVFFTISRNFSSQQLRDVAKLPAKDSVSCSADSIPQRANLTTVVVLEPGVAQAFVERA